MARVVVDGIQDFAKLRENGYFYIDKTAFVREWWQRPDGGSDVSLITRPRRFGKTLMLSTVEHFFSSKFAGRSDLFEGLEVWQDEKMREQQGAWPVIFLSLADVKSGDFARQKEKIIAEIVRIFDDFKFLGLPDLLDPKDQQRFFSISESMSDTIATGALKLLCSWLLRIYGKKTIVLIDEYDTPLQEAWLNDFWTEMVGFLRNLFNSTLKTNPYMERAILTGITRVSKESIFSDLNNLRVYSIGKARYATAFGFTENEVFATMDEYGLTDKAGVKAMYDGYIFGGSKGIYNPWSVLSYLQDPQLDLWWSNTSGNALAGKLVREGDEDLKQDFQTLLEGGTIRAKIDEQIVFDRLTGNPEAVWSLLLASGYLKPVSINGQEYELQIVNGEVRQMFEGLIHHWFSDFSAYGKFLKALIQGDLKFMNKFMNDIAYNCFSNFDTGNHPGKSEPERFYHGFVLGLLVDLRDRYILTSNRESGFGRYDVMLEPRDQAKYPAFVIEFKVHDPDDEQDLKATVAAALAQIRDKCYEQQLVERGIQADRIRKYGFAFRGKEVLIGQG